MSQTNEKPFYTQLGELHQAFDQATEDLAGVDNDIRTANAQTAALQQELESAAKDTSRAQSEVAAVPEVLNALKKEHAAALSERDYAKTKLEKMEKSVGLLGVDPSKQVRVPAENSAEDTSSGAWSRFRDLREREKKGEVAQGSARKFWSENRKALTEYAQSQR